MVAEAAHSALHHQGLNQTVLGGDLGGRGLTNMAITHVLVSHLPSNFVIFAKWKQSVVILIGLLCHPPVASHRLPALD